MTSVTRYPLQRSKARKVVLAAITEGLTDLQIAERLESLGIKVSKQAVNKWRRANLELVAETVAAVEKGIEDYAVSSKVYRIATLDSVAHQLKDAIAEQGATYTEETRHSRRIHAHPAVAELRGVLTQVATELDQLPRAGITVNNQNVVIVKTVATTTGKPHPELD